MVQDFCSMIASGFLIFETKINFRLSVNFFFARVIRKELSYFNVCSKQELFDRIFLCLKSSQDNLKPDSITIDFNLITFC